MDDEEDLAADIALDDEEMDTEGDALASSLAVPMASSSGGLGAAYDTYAKYLADQRRQLTGREKLRAMASGLAQPTYGGGFRAVLGNMAQSLDKRVTEHEDEQKRLAEDLAGLTFKRDVALGQDDTKRQLALLQLREKLGKAGELKLLKTDINPVTGMPFSKDWNRDVPVGYVATNQGIMKREQYLAAKAAGGSGLGGTMPARGAAPQGEGPVADDGAPPVSEDYGKPPGSTPADRKTALKFGYTRGWFDPKGVFHGQDADRVGTPDEIKGQIGILRNTVAQRETLLGTIDSAMAKLSPWTTGVGGELLKHVPGSRAADLKEELQTVGSSLAFDRLQTMRDASPTGGALGQVTERELDMLMKAQSSLAQAQSLPQAWKHFREVRKHYMRVLESLDDDIARQQALYDEVAGASGAPAPPRATKPRAVTPAPAPRGVGKPAAAPRLRDLRKMSDDDLLKELGL